AKAAKEREAKARAAQKEREAKAKAVAAAHAKAAKEREAKARAAQKEREAKAKVAARAREAARKAREKAAVEAKRQREIEAKKRAVEAERLRKLREFERREADERKRQERREAEERRRQEALERKMHSKPYADDVAFLEELRALLAETRASTMHQIDIAESEANEMLVDRERLEYDDEDGTGAASDIQRDQLKEFAVTLRTKVDEIDVALARVADGSYGRCDGCYEPISQARLRAQLPVFTCVSCRAAV
ncbi:MAG TPA: TraR/DksA C4-type zinc finger protein, partial [Acidimicrobiales bacterium]|nr:TraR/DksA C4-type zinc finger protein [Acidimicrobiales bacterium]